MEDPFREELKALLRDAGVIAVLVIDRLQDAVPLARALVAGGVRVMELTLRTDCALDALRAIREEVPEMTAGAGTVLTPGQVAAVSDAGAAFGVSPGLNPRVVTAAREAGLSFAPGVAVPSDVESALELGCRLLKLFPAEPMGGVAYLKSMAAPYEHLGVGFVPLGGINTGNLPSYLSEPLITAIGGSWIAPRDLIVQGDWSAIEQRAREARLLVDACRAQ
jgi:2-dehydro-3-deoxyphosphogluconate aldolase/(4S)-4-hydroxy-2-oxoglutarate aldolase